MQLTSFQRTLLGVGTGVAMVGGGVGLLVARHHRKSGAEAEYRATPVSVDEFVDRTISAYDKDTWGSPLDDDEGGYGIHSGRGTPDGVITLDAEDSRRFNDRVSFYPELVQGSEAVSGYNVTTGREFFRAADADGDGRVTREELTAAVEPYAGSDGLLDEDERRKVIQEGKLAVPVVSWLEPITGWNARYDNDRDPLITAALAADGLLRGELNRQFWFQNKTIEDEGSPAIRIADVEPTVPEDEVFSGELASGPIRSARPAYAKIDEEVGNGNGLLSKHELATWLAKHCAVDGVPYGHVKNDEDALLKAIQPQQIGRVDASNNHAHPYWSADVSKADVDRFYGGSIPEYVDSIDWFKKAHRGIKWKRDPTT